MSFRFFIILFFFIAIQQASSQDQKKVIQKISGNYLYFKTGDSTYLDLNDPSRHQLIIFAFHAEEDTIGMDPGLSINGRWRAINLLNILKQVHFKAYFTTPFRNNILTLQPLVDFKQSKMTYYDQADLETLTEQIKKLYPGPVIVMVHPESIAKVFHYLSKQKLTISLEGNLSEKLLFIQRDATQAVSWKEYQYSIR